MTLRRPALDPSTLPARTGSGYPEPYRSRVLPREKRARAMPWDSQIGVNLTVLPPGKESSMRHYHSHEDELIYIVEGEVVLRTDDGEQTLTAGMCAGFPAGSKDGHQLINRSNQPARYLEISNRNEADTADYPDPIDLAYRKGRGRQKPAFCARTAAPTKSAEQDLPPPAAASAVLTSIHGRVGTLSLQAMGSRSLPPSSLPPSSLLLAAGFLATLLIGALISTYAISMDTALICCPGCWKILRDPGLGLKIRWGSFWRCRLDASSRSSCDIPSRTVR